MMVVLHHVENTLAKPKFYGQSMLPFLWEGQSGVQLFFVISGFVIWLSHKKDIGVPTRVVDYVKSRLIRIIPPLWGVLIILIPVYYFVFKEYFKPEFLIQAFFLLPQEQENWLAVEWTLRHEAVFYAVFLTMVWNARVGSALMFFWILGSIAIPFFSFKYPVSFVFSTNHLLFVMGVFAAEFYGRISKNLSCILMGFGIVMYGVVVYLNMNYNQGGDVHVYAYGLASLLIIFGAAGFERVNTLPHIKLLNYLGGASYSIYLVHYPLISVGAYFSTKISILIDRQAIVFVLLAIFSVLGGVIYYELFEKPINRYFRRRIQD